MSDEAIGAKFHQEMLAICDRCEEIGYGTTVFLTIVRKHNRVEAAKRLIASPETSGLAELALRGRLDLSMEKLMTKPEYQPLFTPDEIRTAANRLK